MSIRRTDFLFFNPLLTVKSTLTVKLTPRSIKLIRKNDTNAAKGKFQNYLIVTLYCICVAVFLSYCVTLRLSLFKQRIFMSYIINFTNKISKITYYFGISWKPEIWIAKKLKWSDFIASKELQSKVSASRFQGSTGFFYSNLVG